MGGESIGRLARAYERDDATGESVVGDGLDRQWSRPPVFEGGGGGTTIFIMQRADAGDQRLPMWLDFWTAVYQAIDD